MSDDYTPTTNHVRDVYTFGGGSKAEFYLWLTAYTQQKKKEAWDEGQAVMFESLHKETEYGPVYFATAPNPYRKAPNE